MIFSTFTRQGIRKLFLAGISATTIVSLAIAAVPGFPFTEDFTSDALKDAAATTADWDTTNAWLELGSTFTLTSASVMRDALGGLGDVPMTSNSIALGDLDGDGDLDAVVGNEGVAGPFGPPGDVNLLYENNNGVFDISPIQLGTDASKTRGMAVGDLDRDGDLDVVAGNFQGFGVYYLNDGSPNLSSPNFTDGTPFTNQARRTWKIALADVDMDGDLDYIEGNSDTWNSLYLNLLMETNELSFGTEIKISDDKLATRSLALGDINNDGDLDLIAGDQNLPNRQYRWSSNKFGDGIDIQPNANTTFAVQLADINGDGYLDLIEGNQGAPTLVYFNGGAADPGNFGAPSVVGDSIASHTTVALIARDFDRDGDIDIVEGNNGDWDDDGDGGVTTARVPQPVRLFLNNGDGTFANGIDDVPVLKQKIYGMDVGDVDNDGMLDFVTASSLNQSASDPVPVLAGNAVYYNMGTESANSVQQLSGVAQSLEVDGGGATIPTARLTVDLIQPAVLANLNFYVSNNNGVKWVGITPGIPVAFPNPNGSQLKWKVDMLTLSPNTAQLPAVNQVDIAANNAPKFTNLGPLNGTEGTPLSPTFLDNYFDDADGDTLTYQVSGLPNGTGLSLNNNTGQLSGTPNATDSNASPITLSVSAFDGASTDTGNIQLTITDVPNVPSAVDDGPYAVDEGGTLNGTSVLANDTDPDLDPLTAVLDTAPANASSFTLNSDGTFVYVHDGSETASDSFTYHAEDGTGQSNIATATITITNVNDVPVLTLNGAAAVTVAFGGTYDEQGATAADEEDGDISATVVVAGDTVDTNTAGTYTVTYDVTDSGGSAADQLTRVVTVAANSAPVITLTGSATVNLTVGNAYADAGATATDAEDGDITASIVVGGLPINTGVAGTYTVTYNVTDSAGSAATEVRRTVIVSAAPTPPPARSGGGGLFGLWELAGLAFAGLITWRRRRWLEA
jgi:hypothetical protein